MPDPHELSAFLDWLFRLGRHSKTLALMAEFVALVGSRRVEFLDLQMPLIGMEAKVTLDTNQAIPETIQMLPLAWRPHWNPTA